MRFKGYPKRPNWRPSQTNHKGLQATERINQGIRTGQFKQTSTHNGGFSLVCRQTSEGLLIRINNE